MPEGFDVDLEVLDGAATTISRTMRDMEQCEVEDIVGPEEEYGHEGLHEAFEHFCDRWQTAVELLIEDGDSISSALNRSVDAYIEVDSSAARTFKAHGDGVDPAEGAIDG